MGMFQVSKDLSAWASMKRVRPVVFKGIGELPVVQAGGETAKLWIRDRCRSVRGKK